MTTDIFQRILLSIDKEMTEKRRKILLFLDNCPAHGKLEEMQKPLKSVKLALLPPNTTSHLQPLDQGIINSLKTHYRSKMLELLIDRLENGKPLKKVDLLQAITLVSYCWNVEVTAKTISNCFRKAGFVKCPDELDEPIDEIDTFAPSLRPMVETFVQLTNDTQEVDINDYAHFDDDLPVADYHENDEEIVQSILSPDVESSDDEGDIAPQIEKISHESVVSAVGQIRQYLMQHSDVPQSLFNGIDVIDQFVSKNKVRMKQPSITSFFKPANADNVKSNDVFVGNDEYFSAIVRAEPHFSSVFSFEERRFAHMCGLDNIINNM